MEIFQLVGIAFVTAIAAILLKATKPELALAVTVAGSVVMLLFLVDLVGDTVSVFSDIAAATGLDLALVKSILKMIGIGYLVEFSAGILNDFGQNALGDKLVLCGKILVLVLALPIIKSVLTLILRLLELIK